MSVWSLLAECVNQLDEPFRRSEIVGWFRRHHPEVLESTLVAHIQVATGNATNRAKNHPNLADRPPLLQRIDHGLYVRSDRSRPVQVAMPKQPRSTNDALRPHRSRQYIDAQVVASISARADTGMPQDYSKLLRLINELNENYSQGHAYAAHVLLRAILDHIPPIFGFKDFAAVANNYRWSRTDKAYMRKLLDFKLQADDVLHRQISRTPDRLSLDDMPARAWVNRLLQESADRVLERQKDQAPGSRTGAQVSPLTCPATSAQADRPAAVETELRALRESAHQADEAGISGDPAKARDRLAALLPEAERILGPEHAETLAIRNRLARWIGEAGDPATARDLAEALRPLVERVFGPSHPDAVAVRATIASLTRAAKDPVSAGDQYAALLPLAERVLGSEHPETLAVRIGLAWSTGEAGDAIKARDQFAALLPVVERVLGCEHPYTLNSRAGLARWTGSAGNAAWARDQFAALLPVFQQVRGQEHPETLYIRHSLARWTGQSGDAAGARAQFAALLPVRERTLGPRHPDTVGTRKNLAHWTRKAETGSAPNMN